MRSRTVQTVSYLLNFSVGTIARVKWLCVLAPVLVIAFFAWVSFSVRRSQLRALRMLGALDCPACGVRVDAVAAHAAAMAEKKRQHEEARAKGVILRIAPEWSFPCNRCHAPLRFDPSNGALTRRG